MQLHGLAQSGDPLPIFLGIRLLIGQRLWEELAAKFHLSKVPPDPAWAGRRVRIPEAESAEAGQPEETGP